MTAVTATVSSALALNAVIKTSLCDLVEIRGAVTVPLDT